MKKFISIFISVVMLLSLFTMPSLAAEQDSKALKTALAEVKTKVDIPVEYSKFESSSQNNGEKTTFRFIWTNEDTKSDIEVTSDEKGRIIGYYNYEEYDYNASKVAKYSSDTVKKFAYEKIKKMMPEAFSDDDTLVIKDYSYSDGHYDIYMNRKKNDISVDYQNVNIEIVKNDSEDLILGNVYINYDYDAKFEDQGQEIENVENIYKKVSPAILQYQNEYDDDNNDDYKISLKYTNDNKYISAYTGEEVEPQTPIWMYTNYVAAGCESTSMKADSEAFTEQELKEIDAIQGLKSQNDILNTLKGIAILKLPSDVSVNEYNVYQDKEDNYLIRMTLSNDLNVTANGKTGEIKGIYNYKDYKNEKDSKATVTKDDALKKINDFLNKYSTVSDQYKILSDNEENGILNLSYTRYVNDIPYGANTINISYNMVKDKLSSYDINYDDKEFPKPDNIVSADDAYDTMLKITPLEKKYIDTDDGYKLCYQLPYTGTVDAFTGEGENIDEEEYLHNEYTDISGHWCEKIVKELEQSEIAFNGDLLKPDEAITQSDFFRLVSCVVLTPTMAMRSGQNEIYDTITQTISPMFEENPQSNVTRENACVYFARILDLGKYVANSSVFKTGFEDNNKISSEALGSVALLSNVGVIGNNGKFRPNDNITYAEASVMLYNILTKDLISNRSYY